MESNEQKSIKVDFHTHSCDQGRHVNSTTDALVKRAFSVGLDAMAIANSGDYFDRLAGNPGKYVYCAKAVDSGSEAVLFERDNEFLYVMRGMEYNGREGHHLILGGEGKIEYRDNLSDTLLCAKDKRSIVGPAHPFNTFCSGSTIDVLNSHVKLYDFVETFNALNVRKYNRLASTFARKNGLPGITNSDDHVGKVGSSFTSLEGCLSLDLNTDIESIKDKIVSDNIGVGLEKYTSFLSKANTFGLSHLRDGFSLEKVFRLFGNGTRYFKSVLS